MVQLPFRVAAFCKTKFSSVLEQRSLAETNNIRRNSLVTPARKQSIDIHIRTTFFDDFLLSNNDTCLYHICPQIVSRKALCFSSVLAGFDLCSSPKKHYHTFPVRKIICCQLCKWTHFRPYRRSIVFGLAERWNRISVTNTLSLRAS